MTFAQAAVYFVREACLNLLRSWKISLLAILTIAVSLFLAGVFFLVSGNLGQVIQRWQGESKIVVYLESGSSETDRERIRERLEAAPWTSGIEAVSSESARERFRETFPSLADLLEGWGEEPLPASLEVSLDWQRLDEPELEAWLRELHAAPAVTMVDDDRDWLGQLEAVVLVLRGLGTLLGGILLLTAIFTISSVIRLTAYLYRDEIAVMRLVGATEFFIRGPLYMEGLLQGLAGALLALVTLLGLHTLIVRRSVDSLLASVLASEFLSVSQLLVLTGLGGPAGLGGAISSLRREDLGETAETTTQVWATKCSGAVAAAGSSQSGCSRRPPVCR